MKPTIPDVLPMVRAYYASPGNELGGSLHIVLEDSNIADRHVEFCAQYAREHGDSAGLVLALTLLRMSKTQRRRLSGLIHDA